MPRKSTSHQPLRRFHDRFVSYDRYGRYPCARRCYLKYKCEALPKALPALVSLSAAPRPQQ